MDKFKFNPFDGFKNTSSFPNPANGDAAREQLFKPHEQTRDFLNGVVEKLNSSTGSDEIGLEIDGDDRFKGLKSVGAIFKKFISIFDENKKIWDDKYTKIEVDTAIGQKLVEIGAGDMQQHIYDSDGDGIIDKAKHSETTDTSTALIKDETKPPTTAAVFESATQRLSGFTIPALSSWTTVSAQSWDTEGEFLYKYTVTIKGVTAADQLRPVFDSKTLLSGVIAPIGESFDGGMYLYASEVPDWKAVCVELTKVRVYE